MKVIGITGTAGSGKSTAAKYLVDKYNFKHLSVRDFIVKEIEERGLDVNRDSMIKVANDLRNQYGAEYIVMKLYEQALKLNTYSIIESIRTVGEVEALKQQKDFSLWGIDAPLDLRYERIRKRKGSSDIVTFKKFKEQEERESSSKLKTEQNLFKCMKMTDLIISNGGSINELHIQIEKGIKSLL